jgi:hypothetical protein
MLDAGSRRWWALGAVSLPLGPILGGWMLSQFWWGWVFLINVPVVSEEHSGIGSAVAQAFQNPAGQFGTAITGTDVSLLVSAGIAVAGVILTLIFLPRAAALQRSGLSMKEATRASEH